MYFLAHHDHIRYSSISHANLPVECENYTIFFIADIHRRTIQKKTMAKVPRDIDIVCIGGDLLEKGVPLHRVRRNIARLKQLHVPIYFVWGNNEEEINKILLRQLLVTEGVKILEDQIVPLCKNDTKLWLAGFQYEMFPESEKPMIKWKESAHEMTVLLTHKPSSFYLLDNVEKKHIDLVLAGHTHGGQIRLFGFGPYNRGGMDKVNNTCVFITEGYGYSLLPLRLGTRAECHVIRLQHGE